LESGFQTIPAPVIDVDEMPEAEVRAQLAAVDIGLEALVLGRDLAGVGRLLVVGLVIEPVLAHDLALEQRVAAVVGRADIAAEADRQERRPVGEGAGVGIERLEVPQPTRPRPLEGQAVRVDEPEARIELRAQGLAVDSRLAVGIVEVEGRGDPVPQQVEAAGDGGEIAVLRRAERADRRERSVDPAEQGLVGRQPAQDTLVNVVVGRDKARDDELAARVEHRGGHGSRRGITRAHLQDPSVRADQQVASPGLIVARFQGEQGAAANQQPRRRPGRGSLPEGRCGRQPGERRRQG
jgi:hypothetical protein